MYLWKENEDMFGTFRYNKTTRNLDHIQLSNDDNVDARGHTLVACDPCRAQKVSISSRCYWKLYIATQLMFTHLDKCFIQIYANLVTSSNVMGTGIPATGVWPAHQRLALTLKGRGQINCQYLQNDKSERKPHIQQNQKI